MLLRLLRASSVVVLACALSACSGSTSKDPLESSGAPMTAAPPPTESEALTAWLERGTYLNYEHESAIHPSAGPHGSVRVFLGPELVKSLSDGEEVHPVGAAAVKELYDDGTGALTGWAVSIKVAGDGVKEDWLWYERARASSAPSSNRRGQPICASCHESGRDYVVTDFPLR
ncbi:MAG TPA: hypothetical protein VHE30_02270 [Polyangiaceae bacterium]|nr:hypothetical protein [Polyangiaceae bacterium]